jgi:enoyl-[acyl-carrier protein] reductase II
MLKTRLTELLGIRHPIIQGAMAWVSWPELVAAVSNAGGLGILGAGFMNPDDLRTNIRRTRELTSQPYAVNLLPDNPQLDQLLAVVIEEGVSVVSYGIGDPRLIMARCKPERIMCLPTVGAVRHAVKAERDGADAIIVQGTEAGGHSSRVTTMVLVPEVAERVQIPIAAAGGFCDARGLTAALAMGAEGISMGTRFMLTQECPIPQVVKERYLRATEEETIVSGHVTGVRCRILKNSLAERFLELGEQNAPSREFMMLGVGRFRKAFLDGDAEWGSLACGQVIGRIGDIPTCQELIERVVEGAEGMLQSLGQRFTPTLRQA